MNRKAHTYSGEELLRRTQEAALVEWNEEPQLPRWDRDGQMVFRVVGWRRLGPIYYLKPKGESAPGNFSESWPEFERWAAKQSRRSLARNTHKGNTYKAVTDFCNRLFVELKGSWLRRAEETLEGIYIDRRSKLELQFEMRAKSETAKEKAKADAAAAARLIQPLRAEKRLRDVVEIVKTVPQPPRGDIWRRHVLSGLCEVLGGKPNAREAGLASILCGADVVPPTSARIMKVSKVIEHEVHGMAQLLK